MATKNYNWISTCSVWDDIISEFLTSESGNNLKLKIKELRETTTIYPSSKQLFRAFSLCPYEKTKVVILGQDPYPNGDADGLAFSSEGMKPPLSLKTMFDEIMRSEYPSGTSIKDVFPNNSLLSWANQGVMLLNTSLTVEANKIGSHSKFGWDKLIMDVLRKINEKDQPVAYMIWGSNARDMVDSPVSNPLLNNPKHLKLFGYHPAAHARNENYPFVGNDHFKLCNEYFNKKQIIGINWSTRIFTYT